MPRAITTLRPLALVKWAMPPLVVFAALLGVLTLVNRSSGPSSVAPSTASSVARPPTSLDTEGQITQLQSAVRADPADAGSYALLGDLP